MCMLNIIQMSYDGLIIVEGIITYKYNNDKCIIDKEDLVISDIDLNVLTLICRIIVNEYYNTKVNNGKCTFENTI